jgi:hypothetical protein
MHKSLVSLAVLSVFASPAAAQTSAPPAPPAAALPQAPAPATPATVKKIVCERVDTEETTGSRLGTAPKRCRTIEVPAKSKRRPGDQSERG